jgi:hypothetical protein
MTLRVAAGTRRSSKDKTMKAHKIALKVLGFFAAVAAVSTLSGCYVVARPIPIRGGVYAPAGVYVGPGRVYERRYY